MLKVFNKVNQHEMNVINNLFQSLIKANVDEDENNGFFRSIEDEDEFNRDCEYVQTIDDEDFEEEDE